MAGRSSRMLAVAVAVAAAAAARPVPEAAADPKARERAIRIGAIGAAMALYITSETVAKDAISPDECRWCSVDALDARVREALVWDDTDRARRLSNVIGYGGSPVAMSVLLLVASGDAHDGRWAAYADDMITMFEVIWGTQLVTQVAKITAGRQRPYAHYRTGPVLLSQEDNLSFFSGHSSLTFSLAVTGGVIAQRRGYRLAPVIWSTGLAIAVTTVYLRMAADRHYFTDILAGSTVGALAGVLLPRLTRSLPPRATLVPQPGGVALVGRF
jgi:hypothetical protein